MQAGLAGRCKVALRPDASALAKSRGFERARLLLMDGADGQDDSGGEDGCTT
jgi:hypothetical protein